MSSPKEIANSLDDSERRALLRLCGVGRVMLGNAMGYEAFTRLQHKRCALNRRTALGRDCIATDLGRDVAAELNKATAAKPRRPRDPAPSSLREDCMNVKGEHDV
jgi:hypothetical protein